ncbi:hypothetical protein V7S43_011422 [Phytophthora oleae]|uniref:Thaumatin-like protein n=1 Tax=Phytophthora oleae TaxID=2107226 RepID=A0ABD3FDG7_9STRA
MQLHLLLATLLGAAASTNGIPVKFSNNCATSISLYDNANTETIEPGCTTTRNLQDGFSGMFRNGYNPQATLAEFTVSQGFLWYDISIIPTGPQSGPGQCSSLTDCRQLTGGVGFNTPMKIAPAGCTALTCLADGCADAYQFPMDNLKTHACPDTTPSVDVTFCPGNSKPNCSRSLRS